MEKVSTFNQKKRKMQEEIEEIEDNNSYSQEYEEHQISEGFEESGNSRGKDKEARERCDLAIARWMIDACVPFSAVSSVYYQPMIDAITSMGAGYEGPSTRKLRGYLLNKNVEEVKSYVNDIRSHWSDKGCTIMADSWTNQCNRTIINFLVYCSRGTVFLKSVDASEVSKTADMLFRLLRQVVLYVGVENVVQVVTEHGENYVNAGKMLEEEFPTVYWSPCATHCINLMLQDMGKLPDVCKTIDHAAKLTKFIYNHCFVLHLMRTHTGGREILHPSPTRFATNFVALQSILAQKDALRIMVTCREWTTSSFARERKAKKFVDDVLGSKFWKECATIVKLTDPLIRVLRVLNSEDKPAMGFLYAAIHKAKEEMIKRFSRRKMVVEPYLRIIDKHWEKQLNKSLHAAGYWFNPSYQYDNNERDEHKNAILGVYDVIDKYAYNNKELEDKMREELLIFKNAGGIFAKSMAIVSRHKMEPGDWWDIFGCGAPKLWTLVIRVLSQTCSSSSSCEINRSVFEHIHSTKRNRIEHQRLNYIVYVHYNLRLQKRNQSRRKSYYDPISFETSEEIADWVLEDEPPSLTVKELEVLNHELAICSTEENHPDIELNLDELDDDDDDDDDDDGNHGNVTSQTKNFYNMKFDTFGFP